MQQEADFGMTEQAFAGQNSRYQGDEFLAVRFYSEAYMNPAKSEEAGRPIFEDTDFIEIRTPGNKDNIVVRRATQMDIQRFPEHYRRYKARMDQDTIEGMPLEEWPMITRSQVEELRFFHIRTVEQLSGLSDANAQNVMGIQTLKQKAKEYLEAADNKATKDALDSANAEIEELKAQMAELLAANKPKRGRPKKVEETTEE